MKDHPMGEEKFEQTVFVKAVQRSIALQPPKQNADLHIATPAAKRRVESTLGRECKCKCKYKCHVEGDVLP